MAGKLQDRIAVVTGSDSGIGRATAEAFAREGADVVITYLHDSRGAEEARDGIAASGRRALVVRLDQRDPQQVASLFRETDDKLGTPYILVNNAGKNGVGRPLADTALEDWDDVLKTNLYGPFYCCREFIRRRRAQGGRGKIVNVTSVHEEIPMVGFAAYDASKGGLRNVTRTLALELAADRINVNNIAPGMILTPMNQRAMDDAQVRAAQVSHIPWKRAGEPHEVAALAVYLASDDADYVTGQSFTIDGGLSMNCGQGA
jgi:glucose 1-dehydrogenase